MIKGRCPLFPLIVTCRPAPTAQFSVRRLGCSETQRPLRPLRENFRFSKLRGKGVGGSNRATWTHVEIELKALIPFFRLTGLSIPFCSHLQPACPHLFVPA